MLVCVNSIEILDGVGVLGENRLEMALENKTMGTQIRIKAITARSKARSAFLMDSNYYSQFSTGEKVM